nr:hypothetical protein [uncultured Flavobacterium sp.]
MVKNSILIFVLILGLLTSCVQKHNDIYEVFPQGSSLNIDLLRTSQLFLLTDNGWVVLYDLDKTLKDGEYNPHLLFYDKNNNLISSSYFLSEDILKYENNIVYANINSYRKKRKSAYRNDLPNGIKIKYLNNEEENPAITSRTIGIIDSLIYYKENNTIDFVMSNDSLSNVYKSIPLYKIHFNYWSRNINLIEIDNEGWIILNDFEISKEQIDNFFINKILNNN